MKIAYNIGMLRNLLMLQSSTKWSKSGMITPDQLKKIREHYKCDFYSPNFYIKIALFLASVIALSALSGLFALVMLSVEEIFPIVSIFYGVGLFFVLDLVFIKQFKHFRSGVNEAILYSAITFSLVGILYYTENSIMLSCLFAFAIAFFSAIRYIDYLSAVGAFVVFTFWLFYVLAEVGDVTLPLMPFIFFVVFTIVFFASRFKRKGGKHYVYSSMLLIIEGLSLVIVYASMNYFVIQELSLELFRSSLFESGSGFSYFFFFTTAFIPLLFLYFGYARRDLVLLRTGLVVLALSVVTFKCYFNMGHPEVTLTLAGVILIGVAILLLNALKRIRNGFTREPLVQESWANMNLEAFVISQTTGGNVKIIKDDSPQFGGGGGFSGGGSGENF